MRNFSNYAKYKKKESIPRELRYFLKSDLCDKKRVRFNFTNFEGFICIEFMLGGALDDFQYKQLYQECRRFDMLFFEDFEGRYILSFQSWKWNKFHFLYLQERIFSEEVKVIYEAC